MSDPTTAAAEVLNTEDPPLSLDSLVRRCDISDISDQSPPTGTLRSLMSLSAHSNGPPVLDPGALHGLPGELVRRIDPHTEADPAAVLVSLLVFLGSIIGPSPYVAVGATRHGANLFALVVGATAKARKGTATAEALRPCRIIDEGWAGECITSGIASGEAIIAKVADPGPDDEPRRVDKRAVFLEEEFARLLAIGRREGNTVSPVIRSAWDSRPLRITTKTNSLKAEGHHVALLGHITRDELHSTGRTLDAANGLLNRHLIVHAQRSKLLPSGGRLTDDDLGDLVAEVRRHVTTARARAEMRRTPDAEDRWAEMYERCADDDPGGLLGAVIARAEPQLIRLALLYALCDGAPAIDLEHLDAAWAMWRYCRDSAAYVFGDALGDPIADRIDAELRANPDGIDRTGLRDLFGRHVRAAQLDAALELLAEHCRITEATEDTAGRPRTVYRSATKATKATKGADR